MRVAELTTTNLRGLRDGTWHFGDTATGQVAPMTVVTGPSGVGLTTFLEGIALCCRGLATGLGMPQASTVLRAGERATFLQSRWLLDADERSYGGVSAELVSGEVVVERGGIGRVAADPALLALMSRYDHSSSLSKVVLVPARRVTEGSMSGFSDLESQLRFTRLSPDPSKFDGLSSALVPLGSPLPTAKYNAVGRLMHELVSTVRLAVTGDAVLEFALPSGMQVPLHALSLAERNAFVLSAAVILMGLQRSVILLDTPEIGLAPGVASRWLNALRRAAPEAQWVVASRDPSVIESVEPSARITLTGG
jgi:hypothetical protein